MTYSVDIQWSSHSLEHVRGLTRAGAQALADYTTKTYPNIEVSITK
jgi:hypothetical protein